MNNMKIKSQVITHLLTYDKDSEKEFHAVFSYYHSLKEVKTLTGVLRILIEKEYYRLLSEGLIAE